MKGKFLLATILLINSQLHLQNRSVFVTRTVSACWLIDIKFEALKYRRRILIHLAQWD